MYKGICAICGEQFEVKPAQRSQKKYCSGDCKRKAENISAKIQRALIRKAKPVVVKKCEFCKKEFTPPINNYAKCCSQQCQEKNYRKNNRDKVNKAKREYARKNPEKTRRWCMNAHNKKRFGGNRRKVLERDIFTCTNCPKSYPEYRLAVHHKDEDKQNNTMENLITLCCSCHAKEHKFN